MSTPMIRTVIALPALLMLAGAAKPVGPMVVRGDGLMDLVVGGKAARIRITPWAPAAPTLNPDFAQSIGLKGGLFGFAVKVGPVKVGGKTSVTRFDFGTMTFRRRVVWFDRRYEAQGDGAMGPGGLPAAVIRFELRPAQPGERTANLPLVQKMFQPTYSRVMVAGREISVLFDPQHARTLATAGAGSALAAAYGGQLAGATGKAEVAFGIERPIRTLRLARPFVIGPLSFDSVPVRIGDSGSVAGIADADADPEEVVVTAKGGAKRRDVLIIGRDALARCSTIVFDKPAKAIRLSCA